MTFMHCSPQANRRLTPRGTPSLPASKTGAMDPLTGHAKDAECAWYVSLVLVTCHFFRRALNFLQTSFIWMSPSLPWIAWRSCITIGPEMRLQAKRASIYLFMNHSPLYVIIYDLFYKDSGNLSRECSRGEHATQRLLDILNVAL